jgi:hypothetical protein
LNELFGRTFAGWLPPIGKISEIFLLFVKRIRSECILSFNRNNSFIKPSQKSSDAERSLIVQIADDHAVLKNSAPARAARYGSD